MQIRSMTSAAALALSACWCAPKVVGAPCASDANCPGGQFCAGDGTCQPACSGRADPRTDPKNCGDCGKVCPTPANAPPACKAGVCGRGPCLGGWFDIDGAATFGCESTCAGRICKDGQGKEVTLTVPPLPEAGGVFHAFASGGAFGSAIQTNAAYTHQAILGESTPAGSRGAAEAKNDRYRHVGGFIAATR